MTDEFLEVDWLADDAPGWDINIVFPRDQRNLYESSCPSGIESMSRAVVGG